MAKYESSKLILLGCCYLLYIVALLYPHLSPVEEYIHLGVPRLVSRTNTTNAIQQRFDTISTEYKNILMSTKSWKVLKKYGNTTINILDDSWPLFIRTTSLLPGSPHEVQSLLRWENFDFTNKNIDPVHESSRLLYTARGRYRDIVQPVSIIEKVSFTHTLFPSRLNFRTSDHQEAFDIP